MKKFFFVLALATYSLSSLAALNCAEIETKQDEEGNISYFTEIENYKISAAVQKKLTRAAVADFYGKCGVTWNEEYCYRPEMNDKEVDELGEGTYTLAYQTPSKKLYLAVNVGFGGGNSALYFFTINKLKMEKVMIIDGAECSPIQSILGHN